MKKFNDLEIGPLCIHCSDGFAISDDKFNCVSINEILPNCKIHYFLWEQLQCSLCDVT